MTSYSIPNTGTPAAEVDVTSGLVLQQNGAGYLGYAADGVGLANYAGTLSRYLYDTGSQDHQVIYTFEASGNTGNRIIVGWVDASNYVYIRNDGTGNRRIYQRLAGVDSFITDQAPQNLGVRYKLRKVGTTITLRLASDDSVLVTATCDASLNGTQAGIASSTVDVLPRWLSNVIIQDNASEGGAPGVLSITEAGSAITSGSPSLAGTPPSFALSVAEAGSAITSDSPSLAGTPPSFALSVAEAGSAITSGSPSLAFEPAPFVLSVAENGFAVASQSPGLTFEAPVVEILVGLDGVVMTSAGVTLTGTIPVFGLSILTASLQLNSNAVVVYAAISLLNTGLAPHVVPAGYSSFTVPKTADPLQVPAGSLSAYKVPLQ